MQTIFRPMMLGFFALLGAILIVTASPNPARAECSDTNTGGIVGGIAGAALGGWLGSQFGSGGGKTAATIGGVVLGGIAGNQLGKNLTPGEIYTNAQGNECRTFEQEVYVNGQPVKDAGTACKQPDGSWQIIS